MIYGAYGYTGALIARHAVHRGHRPILAGRSREKLLPLAEELDVVYRVLSLQEREQLEKELSGVQLVLHAAGPYVETAEPMLRACLAATTHYVDITGEIPVFQQVFSLDNVARQTGVALLPGAGFDVVPSDCLSRYVWEQAVKGSGNHNVGPHSLEIAIAARGGISSGTMQSSIEGMARGAFIRRDGLLTPISLGEGSRTVRFFDRTRTVIPIPWGDLVTAHRTTGAANITTYMALPPDLLGILRHWGWMVRHVAALQPLRQLFRFLVDKAVTGPGPQQRKEGQAQLWARAIMTGMDKSQAEAWLETAEPYTLTAQSSVLCVEKLLGGGFSGALTPAGAFGSDFILEIEGSERWDELPESISLPDP